MAFVRGGDAADNLQGTAGSDTLAGYYNDDYLDPGRGADRVVGGPGADVLFWDEDSSSSGVVSRYEGGDWNDFYDSNIYGDLSGGDKLILGNRAGNGGFTVVFTTSEAGRAHDAYGNRANFFGVERIETGAGDDFIEGSYATILDARYIGSPGNYVPEHGLTVMAGAGNDKVRGTYGVDVLDGGAGNDSLFGGAGNDLMMSSSGDDRVHAGAGDDNVRWGNNGGTEPIYDIGDDTLIGGNGSDLLNLWGKGNGENSIGTYVVLTGSGSGYATFERDNGRATFSEFEQFWTHEGRDTVTGENANIALNGQGIMFNTRWGDDILTGSRGSDTLEGGDGADTINGGRGNDHISMFESFYVSNGASVAPDGYRDVLVIEDGAGTDTVRAFQIGSRADSDRLDVSGLHDESGNRVDVDDVRVGSQNGNAVLVFPNGERVIFEGVSSSSLTRAALIELGIPVSSSQGASRSSADAPVVQAARPVQNDAQPAQDVIDDEAGDLDASFVPAESQEASDWSLSGGMSSLIAASAADEPQSSGADGFDFLWG